jgi:hypothetical protein
MARKCGTCQHIKRAEIDRRIAAGEPGGQNARDAPPAAWALVWCQSLVTDPIRVARRGAG